MKYIIGITRSQVNLLFFNKIHGILNDMQTFKRNEMLK